MTGGWMRPGNRPAVPRGTGPIRHGTVTGYARGCREECCLRAKREYKRLRQRRGLS